MAYGNYAPFYRAGYFNTMQGQPMQQYQPTQEANQYMPTYPQPMPGPSQPSSEFLWVLNENEATAYPVAPGANVVLWDKNSPTIYVKSVNAQGVPSMRVLDFTERTQAPQATNIPAVQFATLDAFNALQSEFEALKRTLDDMQAPKKRKAEKSEVETNE